MIKFTQKIVPIFIMLLLVVAINKTSGQNKQKKNNFGLLLGSTFSNLSEYKGETRIGFTGGLYWNYKISKRISLQTNILYSERGEKRKGDQTALELNYINMPIMAKYEVMKNLNISVGINWDMLLSVSGDDFKKDQFKKNDWGIPLSIGYRITKNLEVGALYSFGISDIFKKYSYDTKNNWGCLTLSYILD